MRGFLFGSLLLSLFAFGACVSSLPDGAGSSDGGDTGDAAGDGGAGGDGSSNADGAAEAGRPTPTGKLQWVFTMDVPSVPNVRLAYDDSGNVIFADAVSGGGSSSITVNGESHPIKGGLAVGKITPAGSLAWLKVYEVTVDIDALDVAATSSGDIWILAGLIDAGGAFPPVQDWGSGAITKASPAGTGDIVWANLSGMDGSFKSAFQMAVPGSGGIDQSDLNYMNQTMRLARVGGQLVGAIGHHGPIVLPGGGSNINVNSGTGEAVTVFRADPVTGVVSSHDVFTGTAAGVTPGAVTVRADKSMAVTVNVASKQGQTVTNASGTGGRGGISVSQTGLGDDTASNPDSHSWFLLTVYSPTDGVSLAQPFNNDGDNSAPPVDIVEPSSVSIDSKGNIEVSGRFTGSAVKMNNVTFAALAPSNDSFMTTISPTGMVTAQPIIATTNTDGFGNALYDPWDDIAATSVYGGIVNILRSTPSASESNCGVSQFKMLGDGGTSWNFGAFSNNSTDSERRSAIAVDSIGGNVAVGGFYTGTTDLGKGAQGIPHGGTVGLFIIGRSP